MAFHPIIQTLKACSIITLMSCLMWEKSYAVLLPEGTQAQAMEQAPLPQDKTLNEIQNIKAFYEALKRQHELVRKTDEAEGKRHRARMAAHQILWEYAPVYYDWWLQDTETAPDNIDWFQKEFAEELEARLKRIGEKNPIPTPSTNDEFGQFESYIKACLQRRSERLKIFSQTTPQIVFNKFMPLIPSFFAYTEGLSDARAESNFIPGTELSILTVHDGWGEEQSLIKDKEGVIRDIDVHFDGQHILFAWKKSFREDDYHLYEMNLKTKKIDQITEGKGYADFEGIYLPDDNIMFNSTRCGTAVDCWVTEVSNLFICNRQGKFMRQIGFDQVHTPHPVLMDDGRVVYTRWDYNDRGQMYTQPLFQMNYDGTGQTEYYGMNSWFPTTSTHAAPIPGTRKIMATITGHHSPQHGKLGIIDPEAGRAENEGVQLIAPIRKTEAVKVDSYGQYSDQFQYPCPLNEDELLISYTPIGYNGGRPLIFGIYWMQPNGARELLIKDKDIASNQPKLITPRKRPFLRSTSVDYTKNEGTYYLQDIYAGESMKGVAKGTIKQLRVVEIEFRTAAVGESRSEGKGGGALISTPPAIGRGAWDVKIVHGTTTVYPDGSAFFKVPSRKPLYFQALDENGNVVQTMRSWSTLQPGEFQSCVGCHEHKNSVPLAQHKISMAMEKGVENLKAPDWGIKGFSFVERVQPILDKHCISCHNGNDHEMNLKGDYCGFRTLSMRRYSKAYISLTHPPKLEDMDPRDYRWQANHEHPEVNWISNLSEPSIMPPYSGGSATSNMIKRLREGHKNVKISKDELLTLSTWIDLLVPYCGNYLESADWEKGHFDYYQRYQDKRNQAKKALEKSLEEYIQYLSEQS